MTRPFKIGGGPNEKSVMIDDRSTTELADHDMRVFEEIGMEE